MRAYQGSFASGELSPSLLGRVDLAKYGTGCKTLTNMLVHPQGGVSKRPGFEMVTPLPGDAHLVPFIFNNEQSYVLAFTDYELRVCSRAGLIHQTEHGGWQDSAWRNQDGKLVDTPQSGANEGKFTIKTRPEQILNARASSGATFPARIDIYATDLMLLKFTVSGTRIHLKVEVHDEYTGKTWVSYSGYQAAGSRQISFTVGQNRRRIEVTVTSSGTSSLKNLQANLANGLASMWGNWTLPWSNRSDSGASASSSGPTGVNLYGKVIPAYPETLTNLVHVEEPGAAHPIQLEIFEGSLYVQAGSKSGESDIMPPTLYEAGEHQFTVSPPGGSMYFTFTATSEAGTTFSPTYLMLGTAGELVLETPYSLEQARSISHAQSADVLFLACRGVAPHKLMRYRHDSWVLEEMNFESPIVPPGAPAVTFTNAAKDSSGTVVTAQRTANYSYVVTAVNSNNKESVASAATAITGPASNNWRAGDYITLSWNPVYDAVEYRVYKSEFGSRPGYMASVKATDGSSSALTYRDYNVSPITSDGPPEWNNPFPDGDYPGVVGMFEQRLVFASSSRRPQTIWLSRSGDYDNFSASRPVKDDDSIEATIASSEVSKAQWMVALRSLILGTTNVEWEIASTGGAFTAKTMKVTPQSYRGSYALPALVIGNSILHVARNGSEVRDLKYDFGSDSYGGSDRSVLAAHLLEGHSLLQWVYQPAPDSIVWGVRDDGVLLGLTYQAEHEVFAWHSHTTQGLFRSVCCVPHSTHDRLYAVVKRGGDYFLELMALPYSAETVRLANTEKDPLASALYLDSALEYDGEPSATLSGLDHLEGMKVGILADGAVLAPRIVENGQIKLDAPATKARVGLTYTARLETMPLEVFSDQGSSMACKKRVTGVDLLLRNTVTAAAGLNFNNLEHIKWRSTEPMGSPLEPKDRWHRLNLAGLADNSVSICVESNDPLPLTLLALAPEFDVK